MTVITKSMFPVRMAFEHITGMKQRYDTLQGQLATGLKSANLAEMGTDRFFDLTMRSRLQKLDAWSDTMTAVDTRLEVLDTAISRLEALESEQRTSLDVGGYGTDNINFTNGPTLSRGRFDEVLDLMNQNVGGRYLFSGGLTDVKPHPSANDIMDGFAGRAGFKQVAAERRLADIGDGMGRLRLDSTTTPDTVTLGEDAEHPFGLKLSTISSNSAEIIAVPPVDASSTLPQALEVRFGTPLPEEGAAVTITFTLPDGTSESITLTAVEDDTEPKTFAIGADSAETTANFAAALDEAIRGLVGTTMSAASTYAASHDFFNAQGQQVMRVDGPPFDTATALRPATPTDTVLWYAGDDSADARKTVDAKIDEGTSINYGVQSNESGLLKLVQTLAAMSIETYPDEDPTSGKRFDAMVIRQMDRLSEAHSNDKGSIETIAVELALAKTTMANVQERQITHKGQLDQMLSDIETVPPEEVTMEILALKTRLEASYETTSLVSQLSLVHYLR